MAEYSTILYTGPFGPTNLYTGSGSDQLQYLDYYRTETDGDYVFHWTFLQSFVSPARANLDYILQFDTSSTFNLPTSFETTTEVADHIIASGYSRSGAYASINAPTLPNWTLILNIDGDGAKTITIAGNTSGAAIASNVQAIVRALAANNTSLQSSYNNFTATYNSSVGEYTLTSGGTGLTSSVVVLGGTGASPLNLGLPHGGYQVTGNTFILNQLPGGILTVTDNTGTIYTDVSATTNNPGPNQFVASLPFGQITLNSANLPDIITIVYFPSTSGPIFNFQNGNVEKGFTVPVPPRIASATVTFYARVAIKYNISLFGPWSNTLTAITIPNVINETFSRLMLALPDFHVYPTDNAYLLAGSLVNGIIPNPLPAGLSNIAKVYLAYANEFDTEYLEKENCINDISQRFVRDDRIGSILGALYQYPQPLNMQNVDYRLILSNMKAASLDGATYEAAKLVGAAFTGVDPTIFPIAKILNFITAGFDLGTFGNNYSGVIKNVRVDGAFHALLSDGVENNPLIPGSLLSGPEVIVSLAPTVIPGISPYTITLPYPPEEPPVIIGLPATYAYTPTKTTSSVETDVVSSTFPYIVTLAFIPLNPPIIPGYVYTKGVPSAAQFNVNFTTGVVTFNAAAAGTIVTSTYLYASSGPLSGQFNVNFITGTITFNVAQAGNTPTITFLPNYLGILPGETLIINIDGLGPQTVTLGGGSYVTKAQVASAIQTAVQAIGGSTSYVDFIAQYDPAVDQYTLISGNQTPTSASTVIVTGGTAVSPIDQLRLLAVNGAIQTHGLTYVTPPAVPAAGQFANNIVGGNGSLLTFPAIEVGNYHTVLFLPEAKVFTYLPGTTTQTLTISATAPYVVTLSNPSCNIPVVSGYTFVPTSTVIVPPAIVPAPTILGPTQFTSNFGTPGVLTFNAAAAGNIVVVSYTLQVPIQKIDSVRDHPVLFSNTEAGFGIEIILNNPGKFTLDLKNIAFLLTQILPATTKFILTEV